MSCLFFILAFLTWRIWQPSPEVCKVFAPGWILFIFVRNMLFTWVVYGGYHLVLYKLKLQGSDRKYHPKWQIIGSRRYLFSNQVYDNVFRACALAVPTWTTYEVLYSWASANGKVPGLSFSEHPLWFTGFFLLIPLWREVHFYFIHRTLHWKPLLRAVHSVHHKNPNPGPWAGLAMHPLEVFLYFSVAAIHFIIASHPLHFFFNIQLTALTPALGHHGFEGPLFNGKLQTGSYFHYLHHRYVNCNFGESTIPLDKWLGRFYDGNSPYPYRSTKKKT